MPWERVWFKSNKAYAKVDEEGRLIVDDGRVEIRYKPDDSRSYRASANNVRPLDSPPPGAGGPRKETDKKSSGALRKKKAPPGASGRMVEVWTDGASLGNPGDAGAGIVMLYGGRRLEVSRYLGEGTNNIAELAAIRIALELMKSKSRPVRIHTDSSYAIGVLSKGWKAKKNPELVGEIKSLLADFVQVEFVKVEGHAGLPENERADKLAGMAATTRKNSETRSEE